MKEISKHALTLKQQKAKVTLDRMLVDLVVVVNVSFRIAILKMTQNVASISVGGICANRRHTHIYHTYIFKLFS